MDIYEEFKEKYPKTFNWLLNTMLKEIPDLKEMHETAIPQLKQFAKRMDEMREDQVELKGKL